MKKSFVSVIIPMYNSSNTIGNCLESLYTSIYKNFEVIVVDDKSTDESVRIANKFPCRIIKMKKNCGPAVARNKGAEAAKGQILFFIDSDTEILRNTLQEMINTFKNPRIDAVVGIYSIKPINKGFFPEYYALLKHYSHSYKKIEKYEVFAAHCAAIKKNAYIESGGYKDIPWGVDIENEEFGHRLMKKYFIVINPKIQVRHNFANFNGLLKIFTKRTYYWVRLFLKHKKFESALTTKSFAYGTVAGPISFLFFILAITSLNTVFFNPSIVLMGISLIAYFYVHFGFFSFVLKKKGLLFAVLSIAANYFFTFVISFGAFFGFLEYFIMKIVGKKAMSGSEI